jgi:hypothetical protein
MDEVSARDRRQSRRTRLPFAVQLRIHLEGLMTRCLKAAALALPLLMLSAGPLHAEVKTRDKSLVKFEGLLGKMMGMFGGKAAKDGLVTTSAVKGDRKAEFNESTGRIVDLAEEKVYEIDMKKKTYKVVTFDELRRQLREAQERASREAEKETGGGKEEQQQPQEPQYEVDFDLKETGQTRQFAGHNARQIVMTVTVRKKGVTLEEGGGLVLTTDSWLGPEMPEMKELAEFELRYAKAIAPEAAGMSAEQMAAMVAMFPLLKQGMERMQQENVNLKGTPLASTMTAEAVKSKEQIAQESQDSGGGGGLGGMLARRVMKKETKPRATFVTINHETLELATSVAAADLEIPAGFKEKK